MKDIMDKMDAFFDAMEDAGVKIAEGQTAIICNDGVVLLTTDRDGVNAVFCNRKMDFDYDLGITSEDIEIFNNMADIERNIREDD